METIFLVCSSNVLCILLLPLVKESFRSVLVVPYSLVIVLTGLIFLSSFYILVLIECSILLVIF